MSSVENDFTCVICRNPVNIFRSSVGNLCHAPGVVRCLSYIVCHRCPFKSMGEGGMQVNWLYYVRGCIDSIKFDGGGVVMDMNYITLLFVLEVR